MFPSFFEKVSSMDILVKIMTKKTTTLNEDYIIANIMSICHYYHHDHNTGFCGETRSWELGCNGSNFYQSRSWYHWSVIWTNIFAFFTNIFSNLKKYTCDFTIDIHQSHHFFDAGIRPDKRNCYFRHEHRLTMHKLYSQVLGVMAISMMIKMIRMIVKVIIIVEIDIDPQLHLWVWAGDR